MGQSEPAPMTAPVGGSVHRMNMGWMDGWMDGWFASSPYLNQHSVTLNLFWLLTFDHFFKFF
jgi:hypothetical protein